MNSQASRASVSLPSPTVLPWWRAVRWRRIAVFFGVLFGFFGAFKLRRFVSHDLLDQTPRARTDLQDLATHLRTYQMLNGRYPTTAQGLRALAEFPLAEPRPKHWAQMITMAPTDPWGSGYIYLHLGGNSQDRFDLRSKGRDGIEGTEDDVVSEPR